MCPSDVHLLSIKGASARVGVVCPHPTTSSAHVAMPASVASSEGSVANTNVAAFKIDEGK